MPVERCEGLDEMYNEETNSRHTTGASETHEITDEPNFNAPVKLISEFVDRPDYPECTLGEHVDIGGYIGVVVAIVKQSIRVRLPEGPTRGFNSYTLRRLYGRRPEPEPTPSSEEAAATPSGGDADSKTAEPAREVIEEPNFDQPIVPIAALVGQPGFPKSAFGQHVDIGGYTGVVVEIINESLKVRSSQGTSRNYNAPVLQKIYGSKAVRKG